MALAFRAAVASSLQQLQAEAFTDWDSSDAFLCQQREDATTLHALLDIPWDLGPGAVKYYGRLRIHPLTEDGLTEPYVTGEGWN